MTRAWWIQFVALYWPLTAAVVAGFWIRHGRRERIGMIFACAWVAGILPVVDGLAQVIHLWSYAPASAALGRMPLALYAGWIAWWGALAPLLASRFGIGKVAVAMALLDLLLMPQLQPVLLLSPHWLLGELLLVGLVLIPALLLARWTTEDVRVSWRAMLLAVCFPALTVVLPPLILAGDFPTLLNWLHGAPRVLLYPAIALMTLGTAAGWSAMRDLALDGQGTPVPLDSTRRLVTTGIYSYVANPMQLGMTAIMLLEAAVFRSGWIVLIWAMTVIYSEGFARWSEGVDMRERYGEAWLAYRGEVRPWMPSLLPCSGHACFLYVDHSCGICHPIAGWFLRRKPVRLEIRDAAGLPFRRITWEDPISGRKEIGVMAVARALQHLHLGWAMLGWLATLPGVALVMQICMDASGTAPPKRD